MTTELPEVKLRALVNFPVSVIGRTAIAIEKTSGRYYFDFDPSSLTENPAITADEVAASWMLVWNKPTNSLQLVPYALAATAGVASIDLKTGALDTGDGLGFTGQTLSVTALAESWAAISLIEVKATQNYIQTFGYNEPGDGGKALYERAPTGTYHAQSADGSKWKVSTGQPLNVLMFGATSADLYTGAQAALDYLAEIDAPRTMRFPGGTYALATKLTCSADYATLILDDDCTINHDTSDHYALIMTGDYTTVKGGKAGGFVGPESWSPATGALNPVDPSVIRFTGEHATLDGVRIFNIYRVGVTFRDVNNGTVINCLIDGNQPSPTFPLTTTVHFGVHFDNGTEASLGNYHLHNNTIRYCTTGCAIANYGEGSIAHAVNITGNIFENMYDHAIYSNYTDGMVCSGNSFNMCHLAVASSGPRNIITDNSFDAGVLVGSSNERACSGVSLRDPTYCVVANNTFFGSVTTLSAICIDLGCFTASLENNLIANNTIRTVGTGCPIRVTARGLGFSLINQTIVGNSIRANGRTAEGLIQIEGYAGGGNTGLTVRGNNLTVIGENANGINMQYCSDGLVCDNIVNIAYNSATSATTKSIVLESCTDIKTSNNIPAVQAGFGGNVAIFGLFEHGGTSLRNESRFNRSAIHSVASGLTYTDISPDNAGSKLLVFAEGTGAPTLAVRCGSQYTRLDGGAGTSFYVNEADGNNWVGK